MRLEKKYDETTLTNNAYTVDPVNVLGICP
jgi:hypothetical protein